MAKLLPPIIESKLPAQKGNSLTIPFLHNQSVGKDDYKGMVLKIKTISTNIELATIKMTGGIFETPIDSYDEQGKPIYKLTIGQFYKAQLAYEDWNGVIGYYSSTGIFKYTGEPKVSIFYQGGELLENETNPIGIEVIGQYKVPENDLAEKVYSYCFNLYKDSELVDSTGFMLHNSSLDTEAQVSQDTYILTHVITDAVYALEYVVTTLNGLVMYSPRYLITQQFKEAENANSKLVVTCNYETGGINIQLNFNEIQTLEQNLQLLRLSSENNYSIVEPLSLFTLSSNPGISSYIIGNDYTVQQGVCYKYWILNRDTAEYISSEPVLADFEDSFLFDGALQLKIKFNPKVTSFKTVKLESKLDTIGGQFPFIFRNGRTNYKEFPISGLISYWMDNDELFMNLDFLSESQRTSTEAVQNEKRSERSINLTGDNVVLERVFKLAVLDWLNDGKPKLFRSSTEGNYIIRLLNISLSPEEKLGRMLHTFNATAYEIAEYNPTNLNNYGFTNNLRGE